MYRILKTAALAVALANLAIFQIACSKSGSSPSNPKDSTSTQGGMVDTYSDTTFGNPLDNPTYLCVDENRVLYVSQHEAVFRIDPLTRHPSLLVGAADVTFPENLWFHDDVIYSGDYAIGQPIAITETGSAAAIPYDNPMNYDPPAAIGTVLDLNQNYIIADPGGLFEIPGKEPHNLQVLGIHGTNTVTDGPVENASFGIISCITETDDGNIYIADSHRIRKFDGNEVKTVAGGSTAGNRDGTGTEAQFGGSLALCPGPSGSLLIADFQNNTVRQMSAAGVVTTIAGNGKQGYVDGPAGSAEFYNVSGIAYDATQNVAYISDYDNNVIRRLTFKK